jgi:hypothetical protein
MLIELRNSEIDIATIPLHRMAIDEVQQGEIEALFSLA